MNKTITAEERLSNIKSMCAERDRKEHNRLNSSRLEMEKREEAERERLQHNNSILNSYIEKAMKRENQHSQERSQMAQNMHDESTRRRSEDAYRTKEMTSAIKRGIRNAEKNEDSQSWDAYMDRNRRLLGKGIEAVKREQNKTYFS